MVELFLDDSLVDLYEDNGISLNIFNSDIDKFVSGSTKGTFSYDITLPATKTNKKLLYFPELILDESFDDTTEKTALLQVDGNVVLNGFARIKTVVIDGGIVNYNIVLYEGNGSWIGSIKDKSIRDINYVPYDHIFNKQNQIDYESIVNNQLVTYPVINFGQPEKGVDHWSVEDRYPAFNARKVLIDIFKDAGYNVVSDFLDGDFFRALWFTGNERPVRRQVELEPHKFKVGTPPVFYYTNGDIQKFLGLPVQPPYIMTYGIDYIAKLGLDSKFQTISGVGTGILEGLAWKVEDLANYYLPSGGAFFRESTYNYAIYHNSFNGRMSFHFNYEIRNHSVNGFSKPAAEVDIKLVTFLTNDDGTTATTPTLVESSTISVPPHSGGVTPSAFGTFNSKGIDVKPNECYYFAFELKTDVGSNQNIELGSTNRFYNTVYDTMTDGAPIYIEDILPNIPQKEFIQDFRTLHNLFFRTDEILKTVYIEPRDSFYTDDSEDWTFKHDRSKPTTISHLGSNIGENIRFRYSVDTYDKYIKTREEASNNNNDWLSKEVINASKAAPQTTTEKVVKNFAPSFVGKGITTSNDARIPIIWNHENSTVPEIKVQKWESRILYYKGRTPLINDDYFKFEGVELKYYPEFTINYVDPINSHINSLNFDNTRWSKGLYYKHWQNTISTINKSRKLEMWIKLTSTDILNLNFRSPKYISHEGDGAYYHLEKVHDYTPQNVGVYKCSFIKVVEGSPVAEVMNSPSHEVTPPYIKDEFEQDAIPQEEPKVEDNIVMTQMVWTSTIDVPTGEFIEIEYNVLGQRILAGGTALGKITGIIIEE